MTLLILNRKAVLVDNVARVVKHQTKCSTITLVVLVKNKSFMFGMENAIRKEIT